MVATRVQARQIERNIENTKIESEIRDVGMHRETEADRWTNRQIDRRTEKVLSTWRYFSVQRSSSIEGQRDAKIVGCGM